MKVRLLIDDMDARAKSEHFAALSTHPNIEVRVFNPFASRDGTLSLVSEGARNFKRINRRMHNKSWIADNRFAIVGGRNLGDEYFGASDEVNFVDLDFGMVGPVVRDVSASFDRYWNSPSAYPLELLHADGIDPKALGKLRHFLANAVNRDDGQPLCECAARRRRPCAPRIGRGAHGVVGQLQIHSRRSAQGHDGKARLSTRGREHRVAGCHGWRAFGAGYRLSLLRSRRQRQQGAHRRRAIPASR